MDRRKSLVDKDRKESELYAHDQDYLMSSMQREAVIDLFSSHYVRIEFSEVRRGSTSTGDHASKKCYATFFPSISDL